MMLVLIATVSTGLPLLAKDVEAYPGPGRGAYQSQLYDVELLQQDGNYWEDSYVYQYGRTSATHWFWGAVPTVNFTSFSITNSQAAVTVRIALRGGYITQAVASPKSKAFPLQIQNGMVRLTLRQGDKAWVVINGDESDPLFIFANGAKPAVPARATYFGPGVRDISPTRGNRYKARSNETIYLDAGAWVRGTIDVRGVTNVKVMGPGVLSGELWQSEIVQALPSFDLMMDYSLIRGDWGGTNATVQDVTLVASPVYNFFGGTSQATNVKLLSPWFYSTDGFQGVSRVDSSFAFVGDNVFFPTWAGLGNRDVTVTNSFAGTTNNAVFCGGFWGNPPSSYRSTVDGVDIKTFNSDDWVQWGAPMTPAVFQIWVDNNSSSYGYSNQTYRNIRVEGNLKTPLAMLKNMYYPWVLPVAGHTPLGNSYNLTFTNITVEGTQKYRSEVKGYNSSNRFHNVVFTNVRMNGTLVTSANRSTFFDINSYVNGISFLSQ